MVIEKVLNNNMVLSRNGEGKEIILKGKGIGFKKKPGDAVEKGLVEKMFLPRDRNEAAHYQQLLSSIPQKYWDVSEQIVTYAREALKIEVPDYIVLNLCDHIAGAVERYQSGTVLKNPMLWDIKRLYPKEFQAGLEGVKLIRLCLRVTMEEDEAGFLAYHFVYSQLGSGNGGDIGKITSLIQRILELVNEFYGRGFNEESFEYQRFLTHLKFFANRVVHGTTTSGDSDLFDVIREKYPKAYACAILIGSRIREEYGYELNQEEASYLMIHIEKITKQKNQE